MATRDPVDKTMQRMEERRFSSRCDGQISSIERADTLREIARLATSVSLPFSLGTSDAARDSLRQVQLHAEARARQLIHEQLQQFSRAEEFQREKLRRAMLDSWTNLTGSLGHLRTWAHSKLVAAEQRDE